MNRLRVKLYSPHVPASVVPGFGVRAAHFLARHCDARPDRELTVTGALADDAGASLPWPERGLAYVKPEQLDGDPNALDVYAGLLDGPAFDVLFLPHPWRCFPAGRLTPNPAPIVACIGDLDFDDADAGAPTDACRQTAELIARDCTRVVFASEGLRRRAAERYGVPAASSRVVRPAASLVETATDSLEPCRQLGLPPEFIVCFEAAGRHADEELADVLRRGDFPWPVVVLGGQTETLRWLTAPPAEDPAVAGRFIRLPMLSREAYAAVLCSARAVVSFTASPTPCLDTPQLDAMFLRRPVLCEATAPWEGNESGLAATFTSIDDLCRQLRELAAGILDDSRIDAAECLARSRTEADVAGELFEIFESVRSAPPRERARRRTGEIACRERRIAWLCNHATLHASEVPLIRSLGFEVYTPKRIPGGKDFRSGAVEFADDEHSTLPRWVLERLNRHAFYEEPFPDDLIPLLNSYFGTVILASSGIMIQQMVHHFRGRILVRVFGREHPSRYHHYWNGFGGDDLWDRIVAMGDRFKMIPPYEQIAPYEPEPLGSRSITLPLGMADRAVRSGGGWTGTCEKLLFVCPSIIDSPYYYGLIYRDFKAHFGDLPHLVAGSQKKAVPDPAVLGYLPDATYRRLLNELRVMYYHSREPRHLHYHPLEAILQGMPVIYLNGGLMESFGGPDQPGACDTEGEARAKVLRILRGDRDLIEAIRSKQTKILEAFDNEFVRREWEEKFLRGIMATPLSPGSRPPSAWMNVEPGRIAATARPAPEASPGNLRLGVYLRTVPGGGVFNYATTLVKKLVETADRASRLELFIGRRTSAVPFPAWPFGRRPGLFVHHLADGEYLPGSPFPSNQPGRFGSFQSGESPEDVAPPPADDPASRSWQRRFRLGLRDACQRLRITRSSHRSRAVRASAAAALAAFYYTRTAVSQRTIRPTNTGIARVLGLASQSEAPPLTFQQICEIAARNDVTFFAYPYDSIVADTPLDGVHELPIVVVMYDLAHEFSDSWGARNLTIHREMHVWAKIARRIVFGSDHVRREAARRYDIPLEKTAVITVPPLVARQTPPTPSEVESIRARYGLPVSYLLNLGYQGPHKNNVVLLEAIRLLRWRGVETPPVVLAGPDARRFLLGGLDDAYSQKVRDVIREANLVEGRDLFVLDYVPSEDIPGLYGGAAACVSMSRSEAQIHGMILEAMTYARPLICSDLPCNVEQLGQEDECALVVPIDDPAALADAVAHLLSRPDETRQRVERASAWIRRMRWEPVLDEYRCLFADARAEPATVVSEARSAA